MMLMGSWFLSVDITHDAAFRRLDLMGVVTRSMSEEEANIGTEV
jgi:hypothetical protein